MVDIEEKEENGRSGVCIDIWEWHPNTQNTTTRPTGTQQTTPPPELSDIDPVEEMLMNPQDTPEVTTLGVRPDYGPRTDLYH